MKGTPGAVPMVRSAPHQTMKGKVNHMLQYITALSADQEPVCLYDDRETPAKFRFGKIMYANETELLLYEISRYGAFDGLSLLQTANVYRIEKNGQYRERMKILMQSNIFPEVHLDIQNGKIKHSFLRNLAASEKIVSVVLEGDETVTGMVERVDDTALVMRQIDYYGCEDGQAAIALDTITGITCDSREERALELLWRRKGNQGNRVE